MEVGRRVLIKRGERGIRVCGFRKKRVIRRMEKRISKINIARRLKIILTFFSSALDDRPGEFKDTLKVS